MYFRSRRYNGNYNGVLTQANASDTFECFLYSARKNDFAQMNFQCSDIFTYYIIKYTHIIRLDSKPLMCT